MPAQVELSAAAQPVEEITEGRHEVINNKEQGHGAKGRRHPHPAYLLWTGIFELNGEDGKLVLRRERTKHGQVAAADWIVAGYSVIKNRDAQKFPLQRLSLGGG